MFYAYAFEIPKNTAAAAPFYRDLHLSAGVIHHVEVQFPRGCAGLAHCTLWHDGHQWQPTNPDGDLSSDGFVITFDEYYDLPGDDNLIRFVGWNTDDTYNHTITIRLGILDKDVVAPTSGVTSGLKKLLAYIGLGS